MNNAAPVAAPVVPFAARPWHKPAHEVLELLALRNAVFAQRGRPCPVAGRVVDRLAAIVGA